MPAASFVKTGGFAAVRDFYRALGDYALSLVAPGKDADWLSGTQEGKSIHFDAISVAKSFSRHFSCQSDANPEELRFDARLPWHPR